MLPGLRQLSYANVTATLALFVALGGTSWAVLRVDSEDVANNSLRSADLRNNSVRSVDLRNRAIRARDVRRNGLGGRVINEDSLGSVRHSANSDRLGGMTSDQLRVRCPDGTTHKVGVCIESAPRPPDEFFGALNRCEQAQRDLPGVTELDAFARSHGPLSSQGEWTAGVYRGDGETDAERLEVVLLAGGGSVGYAEAYSTEQHAFRCVALPGNN